MTKRKITVAEFLTQAIELSGKTQREIAQEAGWEKPNVLSMMKQGITKVPIDRIPGLAKACGVDQALMVRIVMQEYMPEIWAVIVANAGETLSKEERKHLEEFRMERDTVTVDS